MTFIPSSPDDATAGTSGGLVSPLVTGSPIRRPNHPAAGGILMPPLRFADAMRPGSAAAQVLPEALTISPDPAEPIEAVRETELAFQISTEAAQAVGIFGGTEEEADFEAGSDEHLPWLDSTPEVPASGIPGWSYGDALPAENLEIGEPSPERGADVETDSFVTTPAEGPTGDEALGLDPWGAHKVLGAEAGAAGSWVGSSAAADSEIEPEYPSEVEGSHTFAAETWAYPESDLVAPEPPGSELSSAARESETVAAARSGESLAGHPGDIADQLERIARALRERGPEGPLADDARDPLSALITGYLFGLKQRGGDR